MRGKRNSSKIFNSLSWVGLFFVVSSIGLAIFLRFSGLESRGVVLWDTAMYAEKAIQMSHEIRALLRGDSIAVLSGCEWKPGHLVVHGISILLFGFSHLSIIGVQAFFGVIAVIGAGLFGWRMLGRIGALYSVAFLAVAGLPVAMSRTGWPQSITLSIIAVGYLIYQQSLERDRRNLLAMSMLGGAAGIASSLHLASFFFFIAVFATEFFRVLCSTQLKWFIAAMRLSVFCFSTLFTVLLIEGALQLIGSSYIGCTFSYALDSRGVNEALQNPGFGALFNRLQDFDQVREGWKFFLVAVLPYESIIFVGSIGIGLILAIGMGIKKRAPLPFLLVTHMVISLIYFFWFYPTIKGIHYAYLPAAILAGLFWARMLQFGSRRYAQQKSILVTLFSGALIVSSGAFAVWPIVSYKSGYDAGFSSLIQHINEEDKTLSMKEKWMDHSISPLVNYYLRIHDMKFKPGRRVNVGYFEETDLVIVDYHVYRQPDNPADYFDRLRLEGIVIKTKLLEKPLPTIHYHRPTGLAKLTDRPFSVKSQEEMGNFLVVYDLQKMK